MCLTSLSLWCEMQHWGTSDESNLLCTLFPKQVQYFDYHTSIECPAFDHIRLCFPHTFQTQFLHEFLSQSQCILNYAFIGKVLKHWKESLLIFTCSMWKCYIFSLIVFKDDNEIYLPISFRAIWVGHNKTPKLNDLIVK